MSKPAFHTIKDFSALVTQARSLIKGTKTPFFLLAVFVIIAALILAATVILSPLAILLISGLTLPAGLLGLRRAQGKSIHVSDAKEAIPHALQAGLLVVGFGVLSFILSFIPVIGPAATFALMPFTAFGMLFIINRNNTAIEAAKNTFVLLQTDTNAYARIMVTYLVVGLLTVITAGIATIWLTPFLFILTALIYLEATSTEPATTEPAAAPETSPNDTTENTSPTPPN